VFRYDRETECGWEESVGSVDRAGVGEGHSRDEPYLGCSGPVASYSPPPAVMDRGAFPERQGTPLASR
jgi:hypothetical protein